MGLTNKKSKIILQVMKPDFKS